MAELSWLGNLWDEITGRSKKPGIQPEGLISGTITPEYTPLASEIGLLARNVREVDLPVMGEHLKRNIPAVVASAPGAAVDIFNLPTAAREYAVRSFRGEPTDQVEFFPASTESYDLARQGMIGLLGEAPAFPNVQTQAATTAAEMLTPIPVTTGPRAIQATRNVANRAAEAVERSPLGQGILGLQEQRGLPSMAVSRSERDAARARLDEINAEVRRRGASIYGERDAGMAYPSQVLNEQELAEYNNLVNTVAEFRTGVPSLFGGGQSKMVGESIASEPAGLLGRPAVGASGKPTGATEYPVTPEANQIIAAERQAARVGPRQPAQPPAFRDPRFKAPVDPETGMYSPVEEALLNLRQETMTPQQARSYLMNQGLSRGQLEDSGVWDDLQWAQNNNERVTKTGLLDTLGTDMPQQEIQVRKFEQGSQAGEYDFSNPEVIDDYAYIESNAEDLAYDAFSLDSAGSTWYRDQRREIAENYTGDPELVQSIFDELEAAVGGRGPVRMQDLSGDAEEAVVKWADQVATEQYYENPVVRYDIDVSGDGDYYTVVGNEDFGYSLEDARGRPFGDTVYSLNEAEVQIRSHAMDEGYGLGEGGSTKWSEYTMGGLDADDLEDMNYEEILIKAPPIRGGRDYVPSRTHWDDEENVVYHIRKTDRMGDGGQDVLFIEELQSDWHQKGRQRGYDKLTANERREKRAEIQRTFGRTNDEIKRSEEALKAADENPESNPKLNAVINEIAGMYDPNGTRGVSKWKLVGDVINNMTSIETPAAGKYKILDEIVKQNPELSALRKARLDYKAAMDEDSALSAMIPQGMFADDRWISQGLKQMLVKAAKEGKDGVAWTPSHIQVDQWSNRYRKLYETLYDKKLPGIAKKLEKEYGVKFEKIEIDGEEVPYLRLNKKARERIRERGMELSAVAPGIPGAGLLADQQDNEQNQPMRGLLG